MNPHDFDVLMVIVLDWKEQQISARSREALIARLAAAGLAISLEERVNRLIEDGYLVEDQRTLTLTAKGIDVWLQSAG